jgi:signal transduction histidine kinase
MSSGLLALDAEGRVLFMNRRLAEMLEVSPKDWTGRTAAELLLVMAHYALPLAAPRFDWPSEFGSREIEWGDGQTLHYFREDSAPLMGPTGAPAGSLYSYHEITREKAVDRMKSEFISIASHELRTPMTSIKGSVDLILSGYAGDMSPEMQELLEIAQKSCDRLVRLVNDILDLAKIESGQLRLKLEPTDLTEIAVRAMAAVKSLADLTEVRLRIDRPRSLPMAAADSDRIEQVITNLLSNAVKFSPPKGEVIIELRGEESWVVCAVRDFGVGIPEKDLQRIFGKFQQLSEGRRRGGTGLGLAITRALVEEHRGTVWVESRVNEGSRFIFRIPVALESAGDAAVSANHAGNLAGDK